jgi:putative ABC transport system substrate-binding protein
VGRGRRQLLRGALGLLAPPAGAGAQPARRRSAVVGYLSTGDAKSGTPFLDAFQQGLRDLGWIAGQTMRIEQRWAEGRADRLPALAAELVELPVDVIALSGTPALQAARQATSRVPIVFGVLLVDPVAAGFVASLARPGGNITGLASQYEEIVTKQVQLLAEAVPGLSRLALLRHARMPPVTATAAQAAADRLGLKPL